MPRDANGNYTLPAGNPVVSNTLIETAWANPTMADLGAAITDSLDRYGRGGMLAAFKLADGLVTAPALSFNSQSNMGVYRAGVDQLGFAVGAVQRMMLDTQGARIAGDGTKTSLRFTTTDRGTIDYVIASDSLQFGTALIANRMSLDDTGRLLVGGGVSRQIGAAVGRIQSEAISSVAGYSAVRNTNDANGSFLALGKSRGTALGAVTAVQSGDLLGSLQWVGADGVDMTTTGAQIVATALEAFSATNHGTQLALSTRAAGAGGAIASRLIINETRAIFGQQIATFSGDSLAAPGYSWNGDTDKGLWSPGADRIGFVVAGGQAWEICDDTVLSSTDQANRMQAGGVNARLQIAGANSNAQSSLSIIRASANANGPFLLFGKSRGAAPPLQVAVAVDDVLGQVSFCGSDGVDMNGANVTVRGRALEAFTAAASGGRFEVLTVAAGTNSSDIRLSIIDTLANFAVPTVSVNSSGLAGTLLVRDGGAYGGTGANTAVRGIVLDSNGSTGISILTPNTAVASLRFGDPESNIVGGIRYDHATNEMQIIASGAQIIMTPGVVQFPTVGTTASAANAFLNNAASNSLLRSTSSLRYKTAVRDLPASDADKALTLRPVLFKSTCAADDPQTDHLGLIAEEVHPVLPALVHYMPDDSGQLIPDGVAYDRLAVLLLAAVQRLTARVAALETVH